jgi:lysyl endopeptidase
MLSGGTPTCSKTLNNGGSDFYGRFNVAWDFRITSPTRVKDWLGPGNTGVETLDIY